MFERDFQVCNQGHRIAEIAESPRALSAISKSISCQAGALHGPISVLLMENDLAENWVSCPARHSMPPASCDLGRCILHKHG